MSDTIQKNVYRYYDGSKWVVVYFKTSYDQVGVDANTRFLKPSTHTVNGKSFYNSGDQGITLYAGDIKLSSSDNTTIASKLEALQNLDGDLTAIADLTATSGFLKKTAANTWALRSASELKSDLSLGNVENTALSTWAGSSNLTTYSGGTFGAAAAKGVSTSIPAGSGSRSDDKLATEKAVGSFVEGKGYTSNTGTVIGSGLTTDKIVVGNNGVNIKVSTYSVSDLVALSDGAAQMIATALLDNEGNGGGKILFAKAAVGANESLPSSNKTTVTITQNQSSITIPTGYTHIICVDESGLVTRPDRGSYAISELRIGATLYITDTEFPDFWYDGNQFLPLETKVDLSNYATNTDVQAYVSGIQYNTTDKKLQYFTGQYTDNNHRVDICNLGIDNGVITIGGSTITPLTSHQSLTHLAPKASPTFTGTITMPFSSAGFVKTNASGVLSVDTTSYVPTTRKVNGHALSSDVTVTRSDVDANKVFYQNSSPSGMIAGDIWIDTSNTVA